MFGSTDINPNMKTHACKLWKGYSSANYSSNQTTNHYFCVYQPIIMEYNTARNHLEMKEYGRHVQKMVDHLLTIEDKERRQKNAHAVIELMGFINPQLKNIEDYRHKLWDHLFLISDFKLEVDSPYPIPTRESKSAARNAGRLLKRSEHRRCFWCGIHQNKSWKLSS